jgi:uracil-DNA glycosylase family 4
MADFFNYLDVRNLHQVSIIPECGVCGLYKKCLSPKMKVYGDGKLEVMVVAECPGRQEDKQGRPLVGKSGQYLRNILTELGIDLDRDCWTTNAIICRSMDSEGNNRTPTDKEITYCRPNIIKNINDLKPKTIILLGERAVLSVIGWLWREEIDLMSRWVGWDIPSQKINSWVVPSWHPSYLKRVLENRRGTGEVTEKLFIQHLRQAFEHTNRPWKSTQNYEEKVSVIFDPEIAAKHIRKIIRYNKFTVWDFECEGLKPENPNLGIVSCSLSNGKFTMSYPWTGEAITATKELLQSNLPKGGWNSLKYDTRWTLAKLGLIPRNQVFDGMQAIHCLDNRPRICSLEFQEFVQLGFSGHKEWIKPYIKSGSSNSSNQIRKADLRKLLFYGGLDALVSWKICKKLAKRIGVSLDEEKEVYSV